MIKPDWYYKPADVPNLATIQKEFNDSLVELTSPKQDVEFYYINRTTLETLVPSFVKLLQDMNLLDRWVYSAIITTEGDKEFPIHVDSLDWENRCYGLNIPIVNCEDSWTVWYDADVDLAPTTNNYDSRNSARFCSADNAVELCRMPASQPAWINISIPHRPETAHNKLRAIVSTRFSPEVHELLNFSVNM